MLATLIIVFREMIEAGLIIGIVLAATRGVPKRSLWVGYGILGGIAGACTVAAFASSINAAMEGVGQELFNVGILLIAVLMLTWHNVWMARHGREMAAEMKAVGEAVATGRRSLLALSIVVGIAVLREGAEIVLFLYGIAISGGDSTTAMAMGGALGLALGGIGAALIYFGLLRIPTRYLFRTTSWLIALLAAGMAAQAIALLQQAQVITMLTQVMWDSSDFIANGSVTGKALRTLIGYTARPTAIQLMVYAATLAIIFTLMKLFGHTPAGQKVAVLSKA
ncbi:MAG: iron permease [Rickettsiales bacterium]|jgi:high-affinity iron transporter|nr:iron permease [Rickettsiales bacterium]